VRHPTGEIPRMPDSQCSAASGEHEANIPDAICRSLCGGEITPRPEHHNQPAGEVTASPRRTTARKMFIVSQSACPPPLPHLALSNLLPSCCCCCFFALASTGLRECTPENFFFIRLLFFIAVEMKRGGGRDPIVHLPFPVLAG